MRFYIFQKMYQLKIYMILKNTVNIFRKWNQIIMYTPVRKKTAESYILLVRNIL